ncbi:hypothetical protein HBN50_04160 [Halobacteriovorax sp. GB3]|uniref:hypothetical protein n=1 Tax=Halobacteriovorax sp. GB3 TaxID=2719615 RepID=UPI00235F6E04|nr:hypothetical protein [Halobacteriovorax sp. GB3]MDD0852275.1 hypothetical protein [Halobacteriovorax sp. GB3]
MKNILLSFLVFTSLIFGLSNHAVSCEKFLQAINDQFSSKTIGLLSKERELLKHSDQALKYKEEYASVDFKADNREYMRFLDEDVQQSSKDVLYLDVENAVLKDMNDFMIEDKRLVDSISNSFKDKLFKSMRENPDIAPLIKGEYEDYKGVRLRFDTKGKKNSEVEKKIKEAYESAYKEFLTEIDSQSFNLLWKANQGSTGNSGKWFMAGVGESSAKANLAARKARDAGSKNVGEFVNYSKVDGDIAQSIKKIQDNLSELGVRKEFRDNGVLKLNGGQRAVPSTLTIEILRKTKKNPIELDSVYLERLKEKFESTFNTTFEQREIELLVDSFKRTDALSPPVYIRDRNFIPYNEAKEGIISVDFAGVGSKNAHAAMNAIMDQGKKRQTKPTDEVIVGIWDQVETVTKNLNMDKRFLNESIGEIDGSKAKAHFSGDDGVYFPKQEWNAQKKVDFMSRVSKQNPSGFRVTFVPKKFASGKDIPISQKSSFIVEAETVEKDLRKVINRRDSLGKDISENLSIGVDFVPNDRGPAKVSLIVKGNLNAVQRDMLEETAKGIVSKDKNFQGIYYIE